MRTPFLAATLLIAATALTGCETAGYDDRVVEYRPRPVYRDVYRPGPPYEYRRDRYVDRRARYDEYDRYDRRDDRAPAPYRPPPRNDRRYLEPSDDSSRRDRRVPGDAGDDDFY